MTSPKLLLEAADGLATLTLNRPDKLNAIDNEMARAILDALDAVGSDDAVRVVRVRGSGRAFCAGRDVSAAPTETDLELVQAVSRAIVRLTKPVLFSVHGWTVGAGLEWMLNADIVVAAQNSRFKLPEAELGVFVTGGASATLTAYAGLARAKALTLLGDAFTAAQAQAWGLAWHVVPDAELEAAAQQVAARLGALRPDVAHRFKRVFNDIGLDKFERAIDLECRTQRALAGTSPATRP
ncbi:MAG TPA: enoyl-CoA hydratase-related protein [Rubrivivax sp.]|nr:enoyl-CoA hydratase-related protein [Rubrivivax sp.]